jgi:hypothetical protein
LGVTRHEQAERITVAALRRANKRRVVRGGIQRHRS